jgi:HlyD family secretion protein
MLDVPKSRVDPGIANAVKDTRETPKRWGAPSRRQLILMGALVVLTPAGVGLLAKILRPVTVQIMGPQPDVPVQVYGLGTVEARVASQVGFKVSGVLVDLRADVGDHVPKGAVLARLDDREQNAQVARADAAAEQASANLQRAAASVEKAKANYTNAERINERRQKLVENKITAIETAETALAVRDAAFADLNLANSDVEVAKAAVSDAKAQLKLQTATLDFHTLLAPYDAMVTARLKELGVSAWRGASCAYTDRPSDNLGPRLH